jgi:hypothetical protein
LLRLRFCVLRKDFGMFWLLISEKPEEATQVRLCCDGCRRFAQLTIMSAASRPLQALVTLLQQLSTVIGNDGKVRYLARAQLPLIAFAGYDRAVAGLLIFLLACCLQTLSVDSVVNTISYLTLNCRFNVNDSKIAVRTRVLHHRLWISALLLTALCTLSAT